MFFSACMGFLHPATTLKRDYLQKVANLLHWGTMNGVGSSSTSPPGQTFSPVVENLQIALHLVINSISILCSQASFDISYNLSGVFALHLTTSCKSYSLYRYSFIYFFDMNPKVNRRSPLTLLKVEKSCCSLVLPVTVSLPKAD